MARSGRYVYDKLEFNNYDFARATRSWYPGSVFGGRTEQVYTTSAYSAYLTADPEWKVLVSKRIDASGDYVIRRLKVKPNIVYIRAKYEAGQDHNLGPDRVDSFAMVRPGFDLWYYIDKRRLSLTSDIALKRVKNRIENRNQSINVIVPMAELREFRGMIVAATYSASDLVRALIKIKKSKGKSAYQFAAHAWLNWSFAIAPTLSEIDKLAQVINQELFDSGGKIFTEYGAAKDEFFSRARRSQSIGYSINGEVIGQLKHESSTRYTAGIRTPVRSGNEYSPSTAFGLSSPGSLIPALWELTAFSWLFDYFSTMGDYLEDTFIADSTSTVYVNRTDKYVCSGSLVVNYISGSRPGLKSLSINNAPTPFEYSEVTRAKLSNLPSRQLRLKTTDEIGKGAVSKLLNLASILVGGKAHSNKV